MTDPAAEAQPKRYLLPPLSLTIEITQTTNVYALVTVSVASGKHTFMRRGMAARYDGVNSIDALAEAGLYEWVRWLLQFEMERRTGGPGRVGRAWQPVPAWPAVVDVATNVKRAHAPRRGHHSGNTHPELPES